MLDLFGSKRKAILALPEFQNTVFVAKDFTTVVRGMSDEYCFVQVTPKLGSTESYIQLEFSAVLENSFLRWLLNDYYDIFYRRKLFSFQYNYATHSRLSDEELRQLQDEAHRTEESFRQKSLDNIRSALFPNDSLLALYERHKDSGYTDIGDLLYYGFGIPDSYVPSDDEHIPFSCTFSFKTGLSDDDSNGKFKNAYTRKEELTYYSEILMSQL